MAIDAVHLPELQLFQLLWLQGNVLIEVFRDSPLHVSETYPRDPLPLTVRSPIPYLVSDVHMPVNSRGESGGGTSSSGVDQHTELPHAVFLVMSVAGNHL